MMKKYQKEPPYELWLNIKDAAYMMIFKMTPVGYKHALDKLKEILKNNDLSFENDRFEESILIPEYIDGYDDYQRMPDQLKMGNAEMSARWRTQDNDMIILLCDDEVFSVILGKIDAIKNLPYFQN